MGAIELLKIKLAEYPSIYYSISNDSLVVKPIAQNGFEVSLIEDVKESIVFYDGWHEHFETTEEAVKCFMFGLSNQCRIRVAKSGEFKHKWTLEAFEEGNWNSYNTIALIFYPFWRKESISFLQNNFINK